MILKVGLVSTFYNKVVMCVLMSQGLNCLSICPTNLENGV